MKVHVFRFLLEVNGARSTRSAHVTPPIHILSLLQILKVAEAVERGCRHPLAEAVVLAAKTKFLPERSSPFETKCLRTVPGLGASAQVHTDVKISTSMAVRHGLLRGARPGSSRWRIYTDR